MSDVIDFDAPSNSENPIPIIEPEVRRGRGRPKKNPDETPKEKPSVENTHKPKRRKKGPASQDEIADRARAIAAAHATLAFLTKTPEFMLNEQESFALAQANLNLENEFDIQLDGKTMAIITMIGTAFAVYRPRFPAIVNRIKEAQRKQKEEKASVSENAG